MKIEIDVGTVELTKSERRRLETDVARALLLVLADKALDSHWTLTTQLPVGVIGMAVSFPQTPRD